MRQRTLLIALAAAVLVAAVGSGKPTTKDSAGILGCGN